MGKPQMLCRALGIAKPLRNGVAHATENRCNDRVLVVDSRIGQRTVQVEWHFAADTMQLSVYQLTR